MLYSIVLSFVLYKIIFFPSEKSKTCEINIVKSLLMTYFNTSTDACILNSSLIYARRFSSSQTSWDYIIHLLTFKSAYTYRYTHRYLNAWERGQRKYTVCATLPHTIRDGTLFVVNTKLLICECDASNTPKVTSVSFTYGNWVAGDWNYSYFFLI